MTVFIWEGNQLQRRLYILCQVPELTLLIFLNPEDWTDQ